MKAAYEKWRNGTAWPWLLAASLLLAMLYVMALHPVTGFLGGLFVLFTGWAIPSLLNILVTAVIISFFPPFFRRPIIAVPLLLAVSFLLAVAVEASVIGQRIWHPPMIQYSVTRPIDVQSGRVRLLIAGCGENPGLQCANNLYVVANPLARVIDMGGNEGCGCSYWTLPDTEEGSMERSFMDYLTSDVERHMKEDPDRAESIDNLSIVVSKTYNQGDPRLVDLSVEVKDGEVTTAMLTEEAIPRYRQAFIDSDRAVLLNGHFLEIAMHDLSHDTFWSPLLGQTLGYYPRKQVQAFLKEAIHLQ